ncbi:MAG: MAPEG family protein [Alphaproteobacteria bacterium]
MKQLSADQKGVLRGGALAFAITVLIGAPAYAWLPLWSVGAPLSGEVGDHLAYALKWSIPIHLWLAVCIRQVSRGRFNSPADIDGSAFAAASEAIAVPRAILQNSLEQTVLAVGAYLALAVTLRGRELILIPILVAFFLAGRIWFALGYRRKAPGRAGGMVLTAAPTIAALLLAGGLALSGR